MIIPRTNSSLAPTCVLMLLTLASSWLSTGGDQQIDVQGSRKAVSSQKHKDLGDLPTRLILFNEYRRAHARLTRISKTGEKMNW